jgi:hypothetical protein
MNFFKKGKKKKQRFNNPYKIENSVADDVRRLSNKDLVDRATLEYQNWKMYERTKKTDGEIERLRGDLKKVRDEVTNNAQVVEMKDKLKKLQDELTDAAEATLKEELKNLNQPHTEDIRKAKSLFQLALDEIANRKVMGAFEIRNGASKTTDAAKADEAQQGA